MRWLYKIWSGWDGFRASAIDARMLPGKELNLGWAKYADVAEVGDEVWVWFYDGQRFEAGVYVKGIVEAIDVTNQRLVLQAQEWSGTKPLTTANENAVLANVVAPRRRQVFVLPDDFRKFDGCTATLSGASSCVARQCDYCTYWTSLPKIQKAHVRTPDLFTADVVAFAPAFWVVANRSFAGSSNLRGTTRSCELSGPGLRPVAP